MRPLELAVAAGVVVSALGSVWVFYTLASINPVPIEHKFGRPQLGPDAELQPRGAIDL